MAAPRPGYQRAGSSIAVSNKTIILVTDGDRAIGSKIVKSLATLRSDYQVLLGCAETHNGEMAVASMGAPTNVNPIQLDLTSDQSIDHACKAIEQHFGRIDVLVNSAEFSGLKADDDDAQDAETESLNSREIWRKVFDVNVTGTSALTERVLPLLEESKAPKIVFLTSELGKIETADTAVNAELLPLVVSKAAVNRLVVHYAKMKSQVNVNACYLDMNKLGNGVDEDQQATAEVVVSLVTLTDGSSGQLYNSTGVVPW